MGVRIRPEVASLPAYRPGRPAPSVEGLTTFKLSSNENPYPPLPGVLAAAVSAATAMNRYPDMANIAMTEALAARLKVDPGRLAFGTGSVAVLYHLLQAVCEPGDEVVYAWRSFEAYPIAVQLTGASSVHVPLGPGATHDLEAMRAAITPATRVVLLCTPNNPTGPALGHAEVVAFVDAVPDSVLVVIDEAYVEFVHRPDPLRALDLLDRPNVVVLRTFSKAYGLAGFRVGYCVGDPELTTAVRSTSLPFGISIVAQAAVLASLEAEQHLLDRVGALIVARDLLVAGLRDRRFEIPDAQGNFVWLPAGEHTLAYAETFAASGLVVRPFAGEGLRISVGEPEANARLLEVAGHLPR